MTAISAFGTTFGGWKRTFDPRRAELRARIARFVEAETAKAERGDDSETPF